MVQFIFVFVKRVLGRCIHCNPWRKSQILDCIRRNRRDIRRLHSLLYVQVVNLNSFAAILYDSWLQTVINFTFVRFLGRFDVRDDALDKWTFHNVVKYHFASFGLLLIKLPIIWRIWLRELWFWFLRQYRWGTQMNLNCVDSLLTGSSRARTALAAAVDCN